MLIWVLFQWYIAPCPLKECLLHVIALFLKGLSYYWFGPIYKCFGGWILAEVFFFLMTSNTLWWISVSEHGIPTIQPVEYTSNFMAMLFLHCEVIILASINYAMNCQHDKAVPNCCKFNKNTLNWYLHYVIWLLNHSSPLWQAKLC